MDVTDHNHHTLAIIGLGYVGLPLAIEFSKYFTVVGFDIQSDKIAQLKRGVDKTQSVDQQKLSNASVLFTDDPRKIQSATIKILTVPTPIDQNNQPDLTHIKHASELVAQFCNVNDIVVYESTVYPGVTETICASILESISGLRINQNLFLGYSPERLSPGDQGRGLTDIVKVVSGSTPAVCDCLESIYGRIVSAGIYRASSIQVAEAAKVIENTQRDLNVD
ncbi:nucleotide sugar dehydrogenase [Candidatus Marinamargulisbacteria bacterium]|nr:nucleotide sugar dehydrogenase [Candidatus Marinamargulisbacteria bacterium]